MSSTYTPSSDKNVIILGGSYAGLRAATLLTEGLPTGYRCIVIDRNSHFNHLYIFPRASLLTELTPKAFIPLKPYPAPHIYLQSTLLSLTPTSITVSLPPKRPSHPDAADHSSTVDLPLTPPETLTIPYEYLLYSLGATLPDPVNLASPIPFLPTSDSAPGQPSHSSPSFLGPSFEKATSVARLRQMHQLLKSLPVGSRKILVIGGGALGIQLATDIKEIYGSKEGQAGEGWDVTLLHSREKVLPKFDPRMHEFVMDRFKTLDINTILSERAILPSSVTLDFLIPTPKTITTTKNSIISCNIVLLCTGQIHQTHFLLPSFPSAVSPQTNQVRTAPTQQILLSPAPSSSSPSPWNVATASSNDDPTYRPTPQDTLAQLTETVKQKLSLVASAIGAGTGEQQREELANRGKMFAAGDCSESQGVINAGYTAWNQAEIAAKNILKLIASSEDPSIPASPLENYKPDVPQIKLTLGLSHYGVQDHTGVPVLKEDGKEDLGVAGIWEFMAGIKEDEADWNV